MRNAFGAILPNRLLGLVAEVLQSVENFEPLAQHPLQDSRKRILAFSPRKAQV